MKTFQEQELTDIDESALLETCFDRSTTESKPRKGELRPFFKLYQEHVKQLDLEYGAGEKWMFAEKSHQQLFETIRELKALGGSVTRTEARDAISCKLQLLTTTPETMDSLLDVALRIWLFVNFRNPSHESIGHGRPCVVWHNTTSLQDTLKDVFQHSETELTLTQRRLSPHFTAANMVNICGLKLEWATTLDDHLRLDRERKKLWVFPLRDWLHIKVEDCSAACNLQSNGSLLDPEIYEEASKTLDLLFPCWDKKTQKLLKRHRKEEIAYSSRTRQLDLKHFKYFRDRLLELNEDVFLAPPRGWRQLWNDRRDPQKFWTFWIALFVLWLTIVATIATIVQTWAALKGSGGKPLTG